MQETNNTYYVEKILKKRTSPEVMYLVKWEGYDIKESTWEPLWNLSNIQNMIDDFEKKEAKVSKRKRSRDKEFNKRTETSSHSSKDYDEIEKEEDKNFKKFRKSKMNKIDEALLEEIEEGNQPEMVTNAKLIDSKLYCLVKYAERSDGITPDDSYVPSSVLSERCPKLLIDFYESKLKFL